MREPLCRRASRDGYHVAPVDVLALALRYIVSRKVAIVSLFFIMVGVMANIVVQAVMDGFQERIKTHLRGPNPT